MKDVCIGKLGEANVIVSVYAHHDTIVISPKEQETFEALFELIKNLENLKSNQEQLAEPILAVKSAMAKYVKEKK